MMRKVSLFVCVLVFSLASFAQESLNNYKYVLVPKQYEFQRKPDMYQVNSLHKFLFEKAGFEVMFTDETYPADLVNNRCLALTSKLISNPSLFKTRMTVELYDCYNKLVYTSKEGESRTKDYAKAYNETLRMAMEELIETGHQFDPSVATTEKVVPKNEVTATTTISATKIEPAKKVEEVVETPKKEVLTEVKEEAKQEVKEVEEKAKDLTQVAVPVAATVVVEETVKEEKKSVASKIQSIEGSYNIDMWGTCKIVKKGDGYSVVGGDEDFEFATITATSNPSMFMLKKTGFKQVQLLQLEANGDIKIDTGNGFKTYKKVN